MQLIVRYKDGKKDCVFAAASEHMEVDFLTDSGVVMEQIPDEEYTQGFRLKEK